MHFYRIELPKYTVGLTGGDKLHFYRAEHPKDNVDFTGEDNCLLTEQYSRKIM